MLRAISLKNFQSHKDSLLSFTPGVNTIIGQSDSGKTAVLRGLYWAVYNRPSGDSFRSWWGGKTFVEVETDWGVVERGKTDSKNYYTVDGKELKAIRSDVPEEVSGALGLQDINIQRQLDSPFLLSATSGEVARTLNRVVELDDIDTILSRADSDKRAIGKELSRLQDSRREIESELEGLGSVKALEEEAKTLSKDWDKLERIGKEKENIYLILKKWTSLSYPKILEYKSGMEKLFRRHDRLQRIEVNKSAISRIVDNLVDIRERMESLSIKAMKKGNIEEIESLVKKEEGIRSEESLLGKIFAQVRQVRENRDRWIEKKKDLEEELENILPPGSVCPVCGSIVGGSNG